MSRLPAPPPIAAPGIAALCALLLALLAALLGGRRRAAALPGELEGSLDGVLSALAEIDLETEPYVEWVAVPVPWRNGFWWVKPRGSAHMAASPLRCGPRAARVRAPPWLLVRFGGWITGMA